MPAFREFLFLDRATSATHLAGISGVDLYHCPTSVCSFVSTVLDKLAPTSIVNTFVYSAFRTGPVRKIGSVLILFGLCASRHVGGLQFLKHNRSIGIDQLTRLFVQEVGALVSHLA